MKILILIATLFTYVNCLAQNKKDNTIILSGPVSMEKIKGILFQNGFTLTTSDTTYLATTAKQLPKSSGAIKLMILRTDSATYIKGLEKISGFEKFTGNEDFEPLAFTGIKGSFMRKLWEEMDRVAKLLSPSITYAKQ